MVSRIGVESGPLYGGDDISFDLDDDEYTK
jgi:hypothetical protein